MNKQKPVFFIVVLVIAALTYIAAFGLSIGSIRLKGMQELRYGIDIRGGVEAVYVPKEEGVKPSDEELEAARQIMETRLDSQNITDREITIDKQNSAVLVRFPWKSDETEFDAQTAISELGETAVLSFRDPEGNVVVEGKNVKNAAPDVTRDPTTGRQAYVVRLEFDDEGSKKFEEGTGRLVGQAMSIYMDEEIISAPRVQSQISGGSAQITGDFDMTAAKDLANKINAGSLPFSMISRNNSTISPTLGDNALNVMIQAGALAFILICLFMLFYYRLPGFVACISLLLQLVGMLLSLSIPQYSLTLPGIAALIVSLGMGVDANIIVSERIKEEINSGKSLTYAIESGFTRAFSSVFDGNISNLIAAIVLMIFGSGAVLSFGYTLISGVMFNFLAGVTATRLMIKSLSFYKALRNPVLYGARRAAQ